MRHKCWPCHPFTDTSRKRAALRRKQRLEREALPLLADQVAEAQPSEDDVIQSRADQWAVHEDRGRSRRARKWLEARARLDAMSANEGAVLRRAWDCAPYPADPVYLLDFLHSYCTGRVTLDALPFPLVPTDRHGCRINSTMEISMPDFTAHRYPVLAVRCPDCGKFPGLWCIRSSGHRSNDLHISRKAEADRVFVDQHGPDASIEFSEDMWLINPQGRVGIRPQSE